MKIRVPSLPVRRLCRYNPLMMDELILPRKWTFRAHGRKVVFVKKRQEGAEHVLMKAFLWALYLPCYPELRIEVAVGGRYKPDVVQVDGDGFPIFWGEAGQVSVAKIEHLARRYPATHVAIARWAASLDPLAQIVARILHGLRRSAPVDLLAFPPDSAQRFIDRHGVVTLTHADVDWLRLT